MEFNVYSFYDSLAERSLFIVMHYTDVEALREFNKVSKYEAFSALGEDLQFVKIGTFNPATLEFVNLENEVLAVAEKTESEVSSDESLTKYEQYIVICLDSVKNTYFERTFNDESSMQSFINEVKLSETFVGRIFVSVCISSKTIVEVV